MRSDFTVESKDAYKIAVPHVFERGGAKAPMTRGPSNRTPYISPTTASRFNPLYMMRLPASPVMSSSLQFLCSLSGSAPLREATA